MTPLAEVTVTLAPLQFGLIFGCLLMIAVALVARR